MRTLSAITVLVLVILGITGFLTHKTLFSKGMRLPTYITWSSLGPGFTPFEQSAWFSNAFKQQFDVVLHNRAFIDELKVTDALFSHNADFTIVGLSGSYFAQEGLFDYGRKEMGPHPIRLLLQNRSPYLRTLLVRQDSGITNISALRGKRIAWIEKVRDINYLTLSLLRYSGLSASDVKLVPVSEPEDGLKALIAGEVDAAFSPSRERIFNQDPKTTVALRYLPMPGRGNWKAAQEAAPFFTPVADNMGTSLNKEANIESASYPFPLLITRADLSAEFAENFVESLLDVLPSRIAYDQNMAGWDIISLPIDWLIPYHEGAIAVFKKRGLWTQAHQQHNDRLIERQNVLANAWKAFPKESFPNNDMLQMAWLVARQKALTKAGFNSGFGDISMIQSLYSHQP